jgi:AGZA family xanthine/uracil permease-like MFS transporter
MATRAASFEQSGLGRRFRFAEHGTSVGRDTVAGVTTFIVMSYIIFVNPAILGFAGIAPLADKGLPFAPVLTSTCLVAGVMTIIMGLYTNRAYAIAPGLGLNAFVAFTLVANSGLGFPEAMGLIVIEGLAITLLVLIGLRERIMRAIPLELKKAIAIGIGAFIAFIGLVNSGLVVRGAGTVVDLAPFTTWPVAITLFGLVFTIVLRARGIPGDLLIGIVVTTIVATIVNKLDDYHAGFTTGARWPGDVFDTPDFGLVGQISFDAFSTLPFVAALAFVFTLMISDFFDTMGTLVGVGKQAGYLDENGELPEIRKPLLVDSLAASAGGFASASSATTYIESASGVAVGGRTGWVSVVTGALFFPFMFLAPIIGMVPPQATAPALIIVGYLMMSVLSEAEEEADFEAGVLPLEDRPVAGRADEPLTSPRRDLVTPTGRRIAGIDFQDLALGLGAALTILLMPFSFSIADGIAFGFIAYVVIRAAQGQARRVDPLMWVAAGAFALYFLVPVLQQQFSWI